MPRRRFRRTKGGLTVDAGVLGPLLLLAFLYGLYWAIRAGVRDALRDVDRTKETL